MISEAFIFKASVSAVSALILASMTAGLSDTVANIAPVNWEKMGIIGVMGLGLGVLAKLLFKMYEDKEHIYEDRVNEAKEREKMYVDVLKENTKARQDVAAIVRELDIEHRRGEGT